MAYWRLSQLIPVLSCHLVYSIFIWYWCWCFMFWTLIFCVMILFSFVYRMKFLYERCVSGISCSLWIFRSYSTSSLFNHRVWFRVCGLCLPLASSIWLLGVVSGSLACLFFSAYIYDSRFFTVDFWSIMCMGVQSLGMLQYKNFVLPILALGLNDSHPFQLWLVLSLHFLWPSENISKINWRSIIVCIECLRFSVP